MPLINRSISTVKADAAHASFGRSRDCLVVIDSGIDKTHPHFQKCQNLDQRNLLEHRDFTSKGRPLEDAKGRLACAGIIAGQFDVAADDERSACERHEQAGSLQGS